MIQFVSYQSLEVRLESEKLHSQLLTFKSNIESIVVEIISDKVLAILNLKLILLDFQSVANEPTEFFFPLMLFGDVVVELEDIKQEHIYHESSGKRVFELLSELVDWQVERFKVEH